MLFLWMPSLVSKPYGSQITKKTSGQSVTFNSDDKITSIIDEIYCKSQFSENFR